MYNKKLTILCYAINATGHINALLGIAFALRRRNHRVVFITAKSREGTFLKIGFKEETYEENPIDNRTIESNINSSSEEFKKPAIEQVQWVVNTFERGVERIKFMEKRMREIVSKVKPDVIVIDDIIPHPCFIHSNAPLVYTNSISPLFAIDDERLPPGFFGLPLNERSEWESSRKIFDALKEKVWNKMNNWLEENGIQKLAKFRVQHRSSNLNIYMYPKPLMEDFLRLCPLGEEWMGLDHSIRESVEKFNLPENFKRENERLIYLSMGSLVSIIAELMSHLTQILSKCKHKIIVVTGKSHQEYNLAENMWGEPFLPQLEILPLVDLVITHGGNNTFVETLYFGKPMIVLPVFGDQHDNAQRAVEAKIGFKFNPFSVTENELLNAIDDLLNDNEISERVRKISKHMRESNALNDVVERIEQIAKYPKIPTIM
ncbi:glycosyl transferase-like protein [Dinothrombium tinctorium]|uniref:UDP-glucuronosyltransferase n=1 Tax=Dinothrombium tinctorium TaxID=1965070 RepID=A0A443QQ93_9ACAR|nr:glycosyl transferase-like protein [Dinothrombium tinctorium]